jgi:hypothetical protein
MLKPCRTGLSGGVLLALLVGSSAAAQPQEPGNSPAAEARPPVRALRLSEADVLAGFTPEVRRQPKVRDRALALWRMHFAAQAEAVRARFTSEADWRPALADAAALLDEFLEASLLPRARQWHAGPGQVWVEKLDPTTGQRTRILQVSPERPLLLAPQDPELKTSKPGMPQRPATDGSIRGDNRAR